MIGEYQIRQRCKLLRINTTGPEIIKHFKQRELHSVSELFSLGAQPSEVKLSFAETIHQFYASDGNLGARKCSH
jgi:hypothetical protein